jgi:hypothetical protein
MFNKLLTSTGVIACLLLFMASIYSCNNSYDSKNPDKKNGVDTIKYHWINWNIAFTPASVGDSGIVIQQFEDSLTKYVKDSNSSAYLIFEFKHCPCDPLLTNMDVTAVFPSGQPVQPPPTKPNPGPTGDYTLGNNFKMYVPEFKDSLRNDSPSYYHSPVRFVADTPGSPQHRVLAVIDTGLDTLRFNLAYRNTVWGGKLLWQDPTGRTLFNVVLNEPTDILTDQTKVKHGTSVTEISLAQLLRLGNGHIPQIMSIRAFDDSEIGSIYTVSCALSYAAQHNVDFINASWGYFGVADSVLFKYLKRASDSNIRIVAAAGNSPFPHDAGKVCENTLNDLNDLERLRKKDSLFYPAGFAPDITNLVSVTQLRQHSTSGLGGQDLIPCFYQNYSSKYITVGAYGNTVLSAPCCTFTIPILRDPIEGSSFATPVITAKLMSVLRDRATDVKTYINVHASKSVNKDFTLNGNYIEFKQIP